MSQNAVREIYMRVIDATIESARTEFSAGGADDPTLAKLERLKEHWTERLLAAQDFSEDPALVPRNSGGGSRSGARSGAGRSSAAPAAASRAQPVVRPPPPRPPPARVSAAPRVPQPQPLPQAVARAQPATTLAPLEPNVYPKPEFVPIPAGRAGKAEPVLPPVANLTGAAGSSAGVPARANYLPQGDAPGDTAAARSPPTADPPAKRARRAVDEDEESVNGGENLDSSGDSDIRSAGSDPEADNYILAQHDRVRKGTGKWKVQLKEGIAHINGRDYLFNRATCDLDW